LLPIAIQNAESSRTALNGQIRMLLVHLIPRALRAETLHPHNRGVASGSRDFVMAAEHIEEADRYLERGNCLTPFSQRRQRATASPI